jgi:hypothetical protein
MRSSSTRRWRRPGIRCAWLARSPRRSTPDERRIMPAGCQREQRQVRAAQCLAWCVCQILKWRCEIPVADRGFGGSINGHTIIATVDLAALPRTIVSLVLPVRQAGGDSGRLEDPVDGVVRQLANEQEQSGSEPSAAAGAGASIELKARSRRMKTVNGIASVYRLHIRLHDCRYLPVFVYWMQSP